MNKGLDMKRGSAGGFSFIEVLISLLVFAIGFLALSLLQNKALSNNHAAFIHSQASIFAQAMMDKIRANPSGDYSLKKGAKLSVPANTCKNLSSPCSTHDLAVVDQSEWLDALRQRLPGALGSIEKRTFSQGTQAFDNMVLYTVTVTWFERGVSNWGVKQPDQERHVTLESL